MNSPLRSTRAVPFAITVVLLLSALLPMPGGTVRAFIRAAKSPEPGRFEGETGSAGYYESLIAGVGGTTAAARDDLSQRLLGHPAGWVQFHDIKALRPLRDDFLQFELRPGVDREVFGSRFTTNKQALRDRPYTVAKPNGVVRIALLGSSIDMGWGVATNQTYENIFEDWLNSHAAKRGLKVRFEVLNFAVAAYGPLQRLESFDRKAARFRPDIVLYSATTLDTRLLEIHTCNLLHGLVPLKGDRAFVAEAIDAAGITEEDRRIDFRGELAHKETIKTKLEPALWGLLDATIGALADDCRSRDVELALMIVPRVGNGDAPDVRADPVSRQSAIARRHDVPVLDLSATFDELEPSSLSISPGDDHPNARGHKLLSRSLARAVVNDRALYRSFFGVDPPEEGPKTPAQP